MRTCKCGCNKSIEHKHSNARFYNSKHKDKYWNNQANIDLCSIVLTEEYIPYDEYEEMTHPFAGVSLGQD